MFKDLIAKVAGKFLAAKLQLEDDPMDEKKKWFQSKTLWAAIYIIASTAYKTTKELIAPGLPDIPPFVDAIMDTLCGVQVVKSRLNSENVKPIG
jgi:hypothetical protein